MGLIEWKRLIKFHLMSFVLYQVRKKWKGILCQKEEFVTKAQDNSVKTEI